MLKEELHRAFISKSFLLAILITSLSLIYGLADYREGAVSGEAAGVSPFINNAFDAFIWAEDVLLPLLAPLIVVLAFGDSYIVDCAKGYLNFILMRSSYRRYMIAKFLANLVAGGISLALPLFLLYGYTNIAFPRGFPPLMNARIQYDRIAGPLGNLYSAQPDLYIVFLFALAFLFGAAYATLALGFSVFIRNRYLVLTTPFLLYWLFHFLFSVLGLESWSPSVSLTPYTYTNNVVATAVFGWPALVFLAGIACLLLGARKERLYG